MSSCNLDRLTTLFLDFGNTIVDEGVFIPAALKGIVTYVRRRDPGLTTSDAQLLATLRGTPCPLPADHPRLRDVRGRSFDDRFERFKSFVQHCGLEMGGNEDAAMMDAYDQAAAESDCLIKGTHEALHALAQRYRLVIVSNGYSGFVHRTLAYKRLSQHFRAVLVSQDLNVEKPDPRMYHLAALAAGAEPTRSMMVGDSYEADVCGSRAMGMMTCWINPLRQPYPLAAGSDFNVPTLIELARRLECLPQSVEQTSAPAVHQA